MNEEQQYVTKELFEACVSELRRDIGFVKSAVIDAEATAIAGNKTVLEKVDRINGSVGVLKEWRIRHDGVEEGRQQVSAGIRNWIILGFGATTFIQAAIALVLYLGQQ